MKNDSVPKQEVIETLNKLASNPNNIVFVVSSESKSNMHTWYHKLAPKVGLAAENGFFWRWNSENKTVNDWNKLIEIEDL